VGLTEFAGRIGKVINHNIEKAVELIAETRKGFNQNAVLFNSSGEDSPPVKNDKLVLLKIDGTGKYAVVGIFNETQGAKPGEKIFFARDEGGKTKSKLSMLGDGAAKWELDNLFSLSTKATADIEAKEKLTLKGADVDIKGDVVITNGSLKVKGTVAPKGSGALCGCKFCYVTAMPVAGDTAQGT